MSVPSSSGRVFDSSPVHNEPMTDPVRLAIDQADAGALAELLAADPPAADRPLGCCAAPCPPIHAVCDRVFDRRLSARAGLRLAETLLDAGADPNARHVGNGDTLLITACALGCEPIALRLLQAGADPRARGLFGATALHWAAMLGLPEAVDALLAAGADPRLKDEEYASDPLGWAVQGWADPPNGSTGRQSDCAAKLVAAGGEVDPAWLASPKVRADPRMRAALAGAA